MMKLKNDLTNYGKGVLLLIFILIVINLLFFAGSRIFMTPEQRGMTVVSGDATQSGFLSQAGARVAREEGGICIWIPYAFSGTPSLLYYWRPVQGDPGTLIDLWMGLIGMGICCTLGLLCFKTSYLGMYVFAGISGLIFFGGHPAILFYIGIVGITLLLLWEKT